MKIAMCADTNINAWAFVPKDEMNFGIDRSVDAVYRPVTNNIQNGQISGEVTFEFSSGQDEWIYMAKSYLGVDYTLANNFSWAFSGPLAACLFSKGQFFIEGQQISLSNNYTHDHVLSNRLQFSAEFNKAVNQINFKPATARAPTTAIYAAGPPITVAVTEATDGQTVPVAGNYKSFDNLASLFWKLEGLLLPPNSHFRITLTAENHEDFIQKLGVIDTRSANRAGTVTIQNLYLNIHSIRRTVAPESNYILRVLYADSIISNVNAQNYNQQFQTTHRMKKIAIAFQSHAHRTAAQAKVFATNYFTYDEGQGTLQNLQVKVGSESLPSSQWNFAYGYRDAYMHYLNSTGKYNDGLVAETEEEWKDQGKICIEDVVKGAGDLTTNLQVETSFSDANVSNNVYMITFQIIEKMIEFEWSGPAGLIPKFKYQ